MKMGVQWGSCLGGQDGCERERRTKVIVKIKKKSVEGGGQVRLDVYYIRIKVFAKMQKWGRGGGGGSGWGGQGGCE